MLNPAWLSAGIALVGMAFSVYATRRKWREERAERLKRSDLRVTLLAGTLNLDVLVETADEIAEECDLELRLVNSGQREAKGLSVEIRLPEDVEGVPISTWSEGVTSDGELVGGEDIRARRSDELEILTRESTKCTPAYWYAKVPLDAIVYPNVPMPLGLLKVRAPVGRHYFDWYVTSSDGVATKRN